GGHDELRPPVRRIRPPRDVAEPLELVDEFAHGRLPHRRPFGKGGGPRAFLVEVREDGAVLGANRGMPGGVELGRQTPGRVLIRVEQERLGVRPPAHVDIVARQPYDMDTILFRRTDMDEDAIRQVVQSLADAWNVHDAEAFARAFQENAHFTNVFGMEAEGRAAIARFHAPIFETMFRDSRLECAPPKIRFIRPDVAAVDGQWSMTGARDPNGNAWP